MALTCLYIGMSLWLQIPNGPFVNLDFARAIASTERGLNICWAPGDCIVLPAVTLDDLVNCGKGKRL